MKQIEYDETAFVKKGDLVRIRTIDEVKKLYENVYTYKMSDCGFPNHFVKENDEEAIPRYLKPLFNADSRCVEFPYMYFIFEKNEEEKMSNQMAYVRTEDEYKASVQILGAKGGTCVLPVEFLEIVERGWLNKRNAQMEEKKKMRIEATDYTGVVEEMISKVDKRKMKRILSACLCIDAKEIVGIDALLKMWAEAKKDIYLLFDRQLSITTDNEFELCYEEKINALKELEKKFPIEYYYIYNKFSFEEEVFPNVVRKSSGYNSLKKLFPDIQTGMKFTQLIHEVCQNERLDTALSEFYNMTKVKGCVTISIDPVEYMLMSLNNSGWTSCHTLHNTEEDERISYGCYSAGIFSYMCDDASIISFRHRKEEDEIVIGRTKIRAFSKSWRQMVYLNIDEKAFICSRQYPSQNVGAEKIVRETLEKILSDKFELPNVWKIKKDKYDIQTYITDGKPPIADYDDDYADASPLHYNDVLHGFDCIMVYNKQLNNIKDVTIKIGSYPVCPICGESTLYDNERPTCYDCYEQYLD